MLFAEVASNFSCFLIVPELAGVEAFGVFTAGTFFSSIVSFSSMTSSFNLKSFNFGVFKFGCENDRINPRKVILSSSSSF